MEGFISKVIMEMIEMSDKSGIFEDLKKNIVEYFVIIYCLVHNESLRSTRKLEHS